jgi:hypothetical protein
MVLLQTCTVATDHKPLWPRATGPSLLLCRYSGSTVAMGRSHLSLLRSVVVRSTVISGTCRYCDM